MPAIRNNSSPKQTSDISWRSPKPQPVLTASEEQYVEEIAQRKLKYSNVISDNALVFRSDSARMGSALKAFSDHKTAKINYRMDAMEDYRTLVDDLMSRCDALEICHTPEE